MLAARAYKDEDLLRLEEIEVPSIGPGEVLVRVGAEGLSPGLFHFWRGGLVKVLPSTLGHEIGGTIELVGEGVTNVAEGDRVRVHPLLSCRDCVYCRTDREMLCSSFSMIGAAVFGPTAMPMYERYHDGGLAEFVRVPAWLVDPIPDNVSFALAAKVHDLANGMRALKLAELEPGCTLVITAATGTMGTSTIRLAPLFGVGRVIAIGRSRARLDEIPALAPDGFVETIALEELPEGWENEQGLTNAIRARVPEGPTAVIDYFPDGAGTWQAIAAMRFGGTAVIMGGNRSAQCPFTASQLLFNCWTIIGTRSCTRTDAKQVIDLLRTGRLEAEDLVTHRFPLAAVNDAAQLIRTRREPLWMAVVEP